MSQSTGSLDGRAILRNFLEVLRREKGDHAPLIPVAMRAIDELEGTEAAVLESVPKLQQALQELEDSHYAMLEHAALGKSIDAELSDRFSVAMREAKEILSALIEPTENPVLENHVKPSSEKKFQPRWDSGSGGSVTRKPRHQAG